MVFLSNLSRNMLRAITFSEFDHQTPYLPIGLAVITGNLECWLKCFGEKFNSRSGCVKNLKDCLYLKLSIQTRQKKKKVTVQSGAELAKI